MLGGGCARLAIVAFAAAAVLVGVGRSSGNRLLVRRSASATASSSASRPSSVAQQRSALEFSTERIKPRDETRARTDEQRRRRPRRQPRPHPRARLAEARGAGADLVLFPELAVTGYPPEDLLLRPAFVRAARRTRRGDRRGGRRGSSRSSAPRTSTPISTTPATCSPDGEIRGRLPQALPAELRRLRREPLLRLGPRPAAAALRRRRRRPDDLRGHLAARPADDRPGARGRAARRSTSRPRRSTSARTASARRCCACGRATTRASSPTATWSAARTS